MDVAFGPHAPRVEDGLVVALRAPGNHHRDARIRRLGIAAGSGLLEESQCFVHLPELEVPPSRIELDLRIGFDSDSQGAVEEGHSVIGPIQRLENFAQTRERRSVRRLGLQNFLVRRKSQIQASCALVLHGRLEPGVLSNHAMPDIIFVESPVEDVV